MGIINSIICRIVGHAYFIKWDGSNQIRTCGNCQRKEIFAVTNYEREAVGDWVKLNDDGSFIPPKRKRALYQWQCKISGPGHLFDYYEGKTRRVCINCGLEQMLFGSPMPTMGKHSYFWRDLPLLKDLTFPPVKKKDKPDA